MLILETSLACAAISYTIAKTPVFDWLRHLLRKRAMLGYLAQCTYCLAHWVALFLVVAQTWGSGIGAIGYIILIFEVVMVSALITQLLMIGGELIIFLRNQ